MDNKKTFGMFILQRRRELGMTQKEFASRLFVTESAVSKWERGLSYPDITLLQNICAVLEISEHELLSGSEDTRQRNSHRLAERYIRLCSRTRLSQYIFYGGILLVCAIVNLSLSGRLDWFFIVLSSVLLCASLTLIPNLCVLSIVWERRSPILSLIGFAVSLELLLLSACLYTGGNWFGWAAVAALFAISLVSLPFLLRLPLLPDKFKSCKLSLYLAAETLMLLLLLLICCLYTGGDWFPVAAAAILFGLGLVFLPFVLRQLHLPGIWGKNLVLLYFTLESLLLFLTVLLATAALGPASPLNYYVNLSVALIPLALPWGIMLCLRFLPVNLPLRFSGACGFTALWLWTWPILLDAAFAPIYGWHSGTNNYTLATPFVSASSTAVWFWYAAVIVSFAAAAAALLFFGLRRRKKQ